MKVVCVDELTPVQSRMLKLLSDGMGHTRYELQSLLYDDQGAVSNIKAHLTAMRKKLQSRGQGIRYELLNGVAYYRLVWQKSTVEVTGT